MQIQQESFNVQIDPLSMITGLEVISGNLVQSYNRETGEYVDDRTLVPCKVRPFVAVMDPHGIMRGKVSITSAKWYEGDPTSGMEILASNPDYVINADHTLTIKKNIDPASPLQISCVFTFTDTRRNMAETAEAVANLRTTYYESTNFSVKIDQPKAITIDPSRVTKDANGAWLQIIKAQLYSGSDAVADANAAYWLQVLDGGSYRLSDQEADLWLLTGMNADGSISREIHVDCRFFSTLTLKVIACYHDRVKPDIPENSGICSTVTIGVRMPENARGQMNTIRGKYIAPNVDQVIESECLIFDNRRLIEDPESYYDITWKARSKAAGSTSKVIGYGVKISTTSKKVGITNTLGFSIWPEVKEKGVFGPLSDNGSLLLDGGNILITR